MNIACFQPFFASGALQFAFDKATNEGKFTIAALVILSFFSWTVIISKAVQLYRAIRSNRKFLAKYNATSDPLDIWRTQQRFDDAPAFQLYTRTAIELERLLAGGPSRAQGQQRINSPSFETVKATIEEAAAAEAIGLEKGMVVLSTAVAGGPFIGLLGTVWGVMETFAGIAQANAATLTAMAPGVAGALIATVVGLLVAIPAMFAYNFMVTSIRNITQELDTFATRCATQINMTYVEHDPSA